MATIKNQKSAFLETCCRQCSLLAMQPPLLLPPTRGMCLCVCLQMHFSLIFIYLPQQRGQKLNPEILAPLALRCSSFISFLSFPHKELGWCSHVTLSGIREKRETLNFRRRLHSAHALGCTSKIPGCHFWEAPTLIQAMSFGANY